MKKDLEEPIHFIVSPKGFGKTYYEFKKIIKENEKLKLLQKELELMVKDDEISQKTIIRLAKENKKLQERIDNAIEYINSNECCEEWELDGNMVQDNILKILKGDKNELYRF